MRIQIKVYLNKDKDLDCVGEKQDYFVTAPTIDMAIEELGKIERTLAKHVSESPFSDWKEIDKQASMTHSNYPPGYINDDE